MPAEEFVEAYVLGYHAERRHHDGHRAPRLDFAARRLAPSFHPAACMGPDGSFGFYDFTFRYAQDLGSDMQTDAPLAPTALQGESRAQVGEPKGLVESLIIDRIEEPASN